MSNETRAFEFDRFRLEIGERRLTRDGHPVRLRGKVFETLCVLICNHGRLVTKDELVASVWPDIVVEESNLNHNICILRRALGEKASGQKYIETVPRQGYRFVAEVNELQLPGDSRAALSWEAPGHQVPSEGWGPQLAPTHIEAEPATNRSIPESKLFLAVRSRRFYIRAFIGLFLFLGMLTIFTIGVQRFKYPNRSAPTRTLVAVLPFENLTGGPSETQISEGFSQEIISQLGRWDPMRMGVIGRTSSKNYYGSRKSITEIGRELSVDHVIEGSVRRDGNHVRVTVMLVRVSDQAHLWAGNYDGDVGNMLNMQVEIAKEIVREIGNRIAATYEETSRRSEPFELKTPPVSDIILGHFVHGERSLSC